MQIAISGNIGAGKTELTKLLSRHYGYRAVYGPSEENPYLDSFYEDMRRWSFNMMIYSLCANIKQLSEFVLQRRTRIGFPINGFATSPDPELKNPMCATALGLLKMGCLAENQPYIGSKNVNDVVDEPIDDTQDEDDDSPKRPGRFSILSKKLESWLGNILTDGDGVE